MGKIVIKEEEFSFLRGNPRFFGILKELIKDGGVVYLVGGSVRDLFLGRSIKDIDIEVHKLSLNDLQKVLELSGEVKLVGKQFGVLRVFGLDIDWSIPRKDSKGRKPKVSFDPDMTIEEACRRRDLTINAMMIDLSFLLDKKFQGEVEVIDPFYGLQDLKDEKLRAVDEKLFLDDPLRFYRVMQFVGRFEMQPDEELTEICKKMDLKEVAKERIYEELQKLFLKSKRPSLGIRWLKDIGRLKEIMPQVYDLIEVPQNPQFHREGDVFEHTMQALDAAATLDKYENEHEKLMIMFVVLCHDFGKPQTVDENLRTIGHEKAGVEIAKKFMKRFCDDVELIKSVKKLVRYHPAPVDFIDQGASLKAYKRLANKLAPEVTLRQLTLVALCDVSGRNAEGHVPLKMEEDLFDKSMKSIEEASLEHGPEKPVLLGRHLLGIVKEGPEMGEILAKAYEIQIEEDIKDAEELKKRVLNGSD